MELKGKTVLITGADGFIGSHLTETLLKEGCTVKALSQYNSFNKYEQSKQTYCPSHSIIRLYWPLECYLQVYLQQKIQCQTESSNS